MGRRYHQLSNMARGGGGVGVVDILKCWQLYGENLKKCLLTVINILSLVQTTVLTKSSLLEQAKLTKCNF